MHLVECSHFIVPELGPETKFSYSSQKAVNEYREAKQVELAPDLLSYLFPSGLAVAVVIAVIVFNFGRGECCWRCHCEIVFDTSCLSMAAWN